jgi:hypothetical protein
MGVVARPVSMVGHVAVSHKETNEFKSPVPTNPDFGAKINSGSLMTYVCREDQTFNVYWKAVEEAASYTVEVYRYVDQQHTWYHLTTIEVSRRDHYVSLSGLVGDGYAFCVTAENRNGEIVARSGAVRLGYGLV